MRHICKYFLLITSQLLILLFLYFCFDFDFYIQLSVPRSFPPFPWPFYSIRFDWSSHILSILFIFILSVCAPQYSSTIHSLIYLFPMRVYYVCLFWFFLIYFLNTVILKVLILFGISHILICFYIHVINSTGIL